MGKRESFDTLISELSEELAPVKPLAQPFKRAMMYLFAGLFSVVLISAFVGIRMDIWQKLSETAFLVEAGVVLGLAFAAAYSSAWLALPEGAQQKQILVLPYIVAFAGLLIAGQEVFRHGIEMPVFHLHHCIMDAAIMGTIPVALMIFMMRRGAPTRPVLCAVVNALSAGAIGYLGLRLSCGEDSAGHVCIYHIMPFVAVGIGLGLVARYLYRW